MGGDLDEGDRVLGRLAALVPGREVERVGLLGLRFADPEFEAQYRRDYARGSIPYLRAAGIVVAILAVATTFVVAEVQAAMKPGQMRAVGIIIGMLFGALTALAHRPLLQRYDQQVLFLLSLGILALYGWIGMFTPDAAIAEKLAATQAKVSPADSRAFVLAPYTITTVFAAATAARLRFAWVAALVAVSVVIAVGTAVQHPPAPSTSIILGAVLGLALLLALSIAYQLEAFTRRNFYQAAQLDVALKKSEALLLNVLPAFVVDRLKDDAGHIADGFPDVTVLFADVAGFTTLSDQLAPDQVVELLNGVFTRFDELAARHGLEKIKTIGDAYMVAGGVPEPRADHAHAVAEVALAMRDIAAGIKDPLGEPLKMRIGIHSGPVVAGVIGRHKFIYDLWGDTVNVASRMESHGTVDTIQVSEPIYDALKDQFNFRERGLVEIKGKGAMRTWYLLGRREA